MTGHLPNLASMHDPDFMELVWENGQILIRGLSSKINKRSPPFLSSGYFSQSSKARIQLEGGTSTANGSKDGVADSTLADPLSGLSSLTKLDRYHDKNKIKSAQTGYPELLSSGLYEDGFNVFLGADKNCYDKQLIDSNTVVPINKFNKNFRKSYVSKLVEEIPQRTMNSDSELPPRSSLKQYETSIQFMGGKEKKLRMDEESDRVNFSIFLRSPQPLIKANHPSSGGTRAISDPGLTAGAEDLEGNARSAPINGDPFDKEENFMARKMKPILPDSEPQEVPVPDDEQSEAVPNTRFPGKVHGPSSSLASDNTPSKGNPGNRKSFEQMAASSSICSRGASNCPTYTLKRRFEDIDLSKNTAMEEPKGTTKAALAARKSKGAKRKRKTEVHNLSERKRRGKINKKIRALKELIPNCNKVDKASMLDAAIEYLKILQLQIQMMTMGTRVYMPPLMLPSPMAMQHINAQHLGGYSPMAAGMGMMRMQMALGCGPAQFPTSLMAGAGALPGITPARLNTLGVPADQVLLMSTSRSPFVSSAGSFAPQPVKAPGPEVSQVAAIAVAQLDLPGAANAQSISKNSNPTN